MTIRNIQSHELPELFTLYRFLNPEDAPLRDEAEVQRVWNELLHDPKITCFVAEVDGAVAGSCVLIVVPNLTRGARSYAFIENVVTHGDYRRLGIGTALLHHALQTAWEKNCYKVMLLTSSKEESVHQFYQHAGFKRDIKTGYVAHPTTD